MAPQPLTPRASALGTDPRRDVWSDWLLHRRHAGNAEYDRQVHQVIERYADRVLDAARLTPNMILADIGSGDGLVAFRAIDRIGPSLRVLLTDISIPLLRHAEKIATERNIRRQCAFHACAADKLIDIADGCVDVVTTRAVLAYVPDKCAALREFHRILKPGGRISIAEPIFQDDAFEAGALKRLLDSQPPETIDRFLPLLHRWKSAQFPDTEAAIAENPITNYSERDLLRFVQACGFTEIHLELHIDVFRSIITTWEIFLGCSPHPWAPSLGTILAEKFSAEERSLFEQVLRPTVESGLSVSTERIVYLTAKKPSPTVKMG